jgi:hypothetical protein
MAYTPHPTVIVGQVWSAADQNTYVKGNFDAIFPVIKARSGLSTSSWVSTSTGTLNNYTPANFSIQVGSFLTTGSSSTITFPIAFTVPPLVLATPVYGTSTNTAYPTSITSTAFILVSNSTATVVNWIALGE